MPRPEKLDMQKADNQRWLLFQFLESLPRLRGGWSANHARSTERRDFVSVPERPRLARRRCLTPRHRSSRRAASPGSPNTLVGVAFALSGFSAAALGLHTRARRTR